MHNGCQSETIDVGATERKAVHIRMVFSVLSGFLCVYLLFFLQMLEARTLANI